MAQSELYKHVNEIDYLADLVGADAPRDLLKITVKDYEANDGAMVVDITDDAGRVLGTVDVSGTPMEAALKSSAADAILIEENNPLDVSGATVPVEPQTPVGIENAAGTQVDPATEGSLSSILGRDIAQIDGVDVVELLNEPTAGDRRFKMDVEANNGGLATETTVATLATEASLTTTLAREIALWSAGTLPVEQQTPVAVETLPDADYNAVVDDVLTASTTNTYAVDALGADQLDGSVKSTGTYDVELRWLDAAAGTVVKTVAIASGVAGGTWTDLTAQTAYTPHGVVAITDTSAADQTADVAVHLR